MRRKQQIPTAITTNYLNLNENNSKNNSSTLTISTRGIANWPKTKKNNPNHCKNHEKIKIATKRKRIKSYSRVMKLTQILLKNAILTIPGKCKRSSIKYKRQAKQGKKNFSICSVPAPKDHHHLPAVNKMYSAYYQDNRRGNLKEVDLSQRKIKKSRNWTFHSQRCSQEKQTKIDRGITQCNLDNVRHDLSHTNLPSCSSLPGSPESTRSFGISNFPHRPLPLSILINIKMYS